MNDCEACLRDNHNSCDGDTWDDFGQPVKCACWARGHPRYFITAWDTSQVHDTEPGINPEDRRT